MEATATANKVDLSNYDFEILVDKSGSMGTEDCAGGKSRWQYAQETTEQLARECAKFDSDGITVVVFGSNWKVYENTTPDKVSQVFTENSPMGSTNTGGTLEARLQAYFERKAAGNAKPVIFAIVTDGAPDDQKWVEKAIIDATNKMGADEEIGMTFLQVGKDEGARKFLKHLDDELQGLGAKFDIVDTKSFEELENIGIMEALYEAIND